MNAFSEQQQQQQADQSTGRSIESTRSLLTHRLALVSPAKSSSKSKRTSSTAHSSSPAANEKPSTSKIADESRRSSTTSKRSSRPTSDRNSHSLSSTKPAATHDPNMLDPLAFAAASGTLPFPYFLPSLLSQTTNSSSAKTNHLAGMGAYPFSNLSSSLANPAAALYPFLSPDWFTASAKMTDNLEEFNSLKPKGSPSRSLDDPIDVLSSRFERNTETENSRQFVFIVVPVARRSNVSQGTSAKERNFDSIQTCILVEETSQIHSCPNRRTRGASREATVERFHEKVNLSEPQPSTFSTGKFSTLFRSIRDNLFVKDEVIALVDEPGLITGRLSV